MNVLKDFYLKIFLIIFMQIVKIRSLYASMVIESEISFNFLRRKGNFVPCHIFSFRIFERARILLFTTSDQWGECFTQQTEFA